MHRSSVVRLRHHRRDFDRADQCRAGNRNVRARRGGQQDDGGRARADHRGGGAGGRGGHGKERAKLPPTGKYLESAQWGVDELVRKEILRHPLCVYVIGILTSLRAVQHALMHHDSTLSDEHKRVVEDWLQATPLSTPELHFIRTSRNLILKRGSFESYAILRNLRQARNRT